MSLRPFRLTTLLEAVKLAEVRFWESAALGLNNATTYQSDALEVMGRDIGGILAELVVGRKFDRTYLPAMNTFHKQADVGEDIEVRSTPHLNGSLILRDNDDPGRRYVLVICDPMQGFEVKGWCYGIEAMTPQWHMTGEGRPHWRYKGPLRPFSTLTLERPKHAPTNAETASAEYVW